MASEKTLARLDTLIWVLIYGGLFAVVLGLAGQSTHAGGSWAWPCLVAGVAVALIGVALVWVRSRIGPSKG